jgi:hypothetical protein
LKGPDARPLRCILNLGRALSSGSSEDISIHRNH